MAVISQARNRRSQKAPSMFALREAFAYPEWSQCDSVPVSSSPKFNGDQKSLFITKLCDVYHKKNPPTIKVGHKNCGEGRKFLERGCLTCGAANCRTGQKIAVSLGGERKSTGSESVTTLYQAPPKDNFMITLVLQGGQANPVTFIVFDGVSENSTVGNKLLC